MPLDEPTNQEWDSFAKHLGVDQLSREEQYAAMIRHGEESLHKAYVYLFENCPPEYRDEFLTRIAQDPTTSEFKEFLKEKIPHVDTHTMWSSVIAKQ